MPTIPGALTAPQANPPPCNGHHLQLPPQPRRRVSSTTTAASPASTTFTNSHARTRTARDRARTRPTRSSAAPARASTTQCSTAITPAQLPRPSCRATSPARAAPISMRRLPLRLSLRHPAGPCKQARPCRPYADTLHSQRTPPQHQRQRHQPPDLARPSLSPSARSARTTSPRRRTTARPRSAPPSARHLPTQQEEEEGQKGSPSSRASPWPRSSRAPHKAGRSSMYLAGTRQHSSRRRSRRARTPPVRLSLSNSNSRAG